MGIAVIVLLIAQLKLHPFLSLTIGSIGVGALAGMHLSDALTSFGTDVADTDRARRDVRPAARRLRRTCGTVRHWR